MLRSDQIRSWQRVGLCGLLGVAVHGFAIADTPTPPTKPAQASATPAAKATHHTSGHVATKRTSGQTSSQKSKSSHGKKGSKYSSKKRGQQAIDSGRARQIQTALIREHYMQGEPSGSWDSATQAAMKRYQADQGWQSKQIPDSRALIKLGLGPSHDHLLNPESAMTMPTMPPPADPKAAVKPVPADGVPKN
jgi:peptidoglycan hydrolase-like protein with peptidoglycan-binding domain